MIAPSARVGDLAEQVRGVTYGKDDASRTPASGYIPVLRAGNITDTGLVFDDLVYVPAAKVSSKQKIRRGDIVIAASSGSLDVVGKAAPALAAFDGGFGAFCKVIRPNDKVDAGYLAQFFKTPSYRRTISSLAAGANINNLKSEHLDDLLLPLPPLPEQRRIAAILDQADALRAKRREALAQLDSLTQSIFIEMFGDFVANPKGFSVSLLGKVCDVRDGTHDSPKYVTDGYPLVTSKNLSGGYVDLTDVNLISERDYDAINKRSKVDRGDLLMPMIGTIGNPVLIEHDPAYAVKNVAIVKFPEGSPSNIFIQAVLSGAYFDHVVSQKNRGGTQKFLSLGDLRSIPVPLPPPSLQHRFASRIQAVKSLKATHRAALTELDALFASLQHRAFAGQLS